MYREDYSIPNKPVESAKKLVRDTLLSGFDIYPIQLFSVIRTKSYGQLRNSLGEQGWRSGESTRLPPMWPWFESWRRRHMWVEFVVGSLLCS